MERLCDFSTTDEPIELPPGFRFHPTDEELITHYLSPKVINSNFVTIAVGEVDLNKVEPWDLPWKAKMGEKEWYFFCVRDRKYPTGSRTNRATESGYWKATGKDKEIFRAKILVGMKKTLVFYRGRAPKGEKTNWVMHEYRLEGKHSMHKTAKNEWVICRIFKKNSGGNKVHISGLVRSRNSGFDLPQLMDFSRDENQTRTASGAERSHVTCFSNPMEDDPRDKPGDEFSSKNGDFPFIFSQAPNPESVLLQDQSMLRLLFETNSPCMKQNAKQEFSEEIGVNADFSSAISNIGVGFKPYVDDQDFSILSSGVEFDCLWNY
ncbi:hypothetical protein DH2020_012638 [Rehmannia glutinosa]|uniref:NAC domain-containing protein n=1 Tax=Rehmannia glutinosa TaxID=99300 RepID=A0ABR0X346_REHGL